MALKTLVALLALLCLAATAVAEPPAVVTLVFNAADGALVSRETIGDDDALAQLNVIGPGSTLKPFLIAAALEGGLSNTHTVHCAPHPIETPPEKRCWLAVGHGTVGLRRGLAHSCSIYARHACAHVDADRYHRLLTDAGFSHLPDRPTFRKAGCEVWMGAKPGIAATPSELAEAYRRAFVAADGLPVAGRAEILAGLHDACLVGTGKAVREAAPLLDVRGKTGTGHTLGGRQVGVFVGWTPSAASRWLIVVVELDGTGAEAARRAGARLAKLVEDAAGR